jgi:hypothetical protein
MHLHYCNSLDCKRPQKVNNYLNIEFNLNLTQRLLSIITGCISYTNISLSYLIKIHIKAYIHGYLSC